MGSGCMMNAIVIVFALFFSPKLVPEPQQTLSTPTMQPVLKHPLHYRQKQSQHAPTTQTRQNNIEVNKK
jgi:hypothetical protein